MVGSVVGADRSDVAVSGAKHAQVGRRNWWRCSGTSPSCEMSRASLSQHLHQKFWSLSCSRRFWLPSLIPCRKSSFEGRICSVGILGEAQCRRYKWPPGSSPAPRGAEVPSQPVTNSSCHLNALTSAGPAPLPPNELPHPGNGPALRDHSEGRAGGRFGSWCHRGLCPWHAAHAKHT